MSEDKRFREPRGAFPPPPDCHATAARKSPMETLGSLCVHALTLSTLVWQAVGSSFRVSVRGSHHPKTGLRSPWSPICKLP